MKAKFYTLLLVTLVNSVAFAQAVTTVNAMSGEISDNLDLRAVASIFGESRDLEDFERRLNDPNLQISNLDLNNDYQVDYLRVIESTERFTHLIVIQAVLGRDLYQDVATVEVERDVHNNVQVQVVGDVYMYGQNYIYEPVYVSAPIIYNTFWVTHYRPYCSNWNWGYYPTYYSYWQPYPVFRYRRNVYVHIDIHNHYNYVNVRRSQRAVALYSTRRSDAYAKQYPNRSFAQRNANVVNRYELDQRRTVKDVGVRNGLAANNTRTVTPMHNDNVSNPAYSAIRNENSAGARNSSISTANTIETSTNAIRSENNAGTQNNAIRNGHTAETRTDYIGSNNAPSIRESANMSQSSSTRSNTIKQGNNISQWSDPNNSAPNMRSSSNTNENRAVYSGNVSTSTPVRQSNQSQAPRVQSQIQPRAQSTEVRKLSTNVERSMATSQNRFENAGNKPSRR